jgi:uncharacterized membrane protein YgdD (TMEM256/DUF423 family)
MTSDPLLQRALSPLALATIAFAALIGASAVMLGAAASHGLEPPAARLAEIASHYGLAHAPVLMGAALILDRTRGWPRTLITLAIALFTAGLIGFCGGLAARVFDIMIWPLQWGGIALIAAWIALASAAIGALAARWR